MKRLGASSSRKSCSPNLTNTRRKSNNQYIADLRMNNAKLATSLANEKSKYYKIFQSYTVMQKQLVGQQAKLRNIAGAAKAAVEKFRGGLDLMIEASDLLSTVNTEIEILCPELGSAQKCNVLVMSPNQRPCLNDAESQPSDITTRRMNCNQGEPVSRGSPSTSTPTLGTARPMVQGQIISTHPTISLQRVTVPVPLGRGNPRQPERGVDLNMGNNALSRLSNISEESTESLRRENHLGSNVPQSPSTSESQSMPESHVLLERLLPAHDDQTIESDDEDNQLTTVHFGNWTFSRYSSPRKQPSDISSPNPRLNSPSKPELEEAESSSDDEDVVLQILESKRSYLEHDRQLESKEGTSWNYDDTGKFHKRPPRKRSTPQSKSPRNISARDTHSPIKKAETVDNPKVPRCARSLQTPETPKPEAVRELQSSNSPNDSNCSNFDEVNMSLTECQSNKIDINAFMEFRERSAGEKANTDMTDVLNISGEKEDSFRNTFVTQRSRRKRSASDDGDQFNEHFSLSPLNSNRNNASSSVENNENSPPIAAQNIENNQSHLNETMHRSHHEFSDKPSYVVLERLPSYLYGHNGVTTQVNCSDSDVQSKRDVPPAIAQKESVCAPARNSDSKCQNSPSRQSSLSETLSRTSSSSAGKQIQVKQNKDKPGPKRSKQRRKDEANGTPLQPPTTCSAPSSHLSSRNDNTDEPVPKRPKQSKKDEANGTPVQAPSTCSAPSSPHSSRNGDTDKPGPKRSKQRRKDEANGPPVQPHTTCSAPSSPHSSRNGDTDKPGPIRSKQRRKDEANGPPVQPHTTCSAPSSPHSSRNGETSECESVDYEERRGRPKRTAAPVNLKEPKLTTKLRRK